MFHLSSLPFAILEGVTRFYIPLSMCACICLYYRLPSHPRTMWYLGRAFELVGIILGLENHWLLSFSNTPWRTHQNTLTLTHPHTHKEPHQEVDICTYEGTRNCDRIMYLDGWLLCWVTMGGVYDDYHVCARRNELYKLV